MHPLMSGPTPLNPGCPTPLHSLDPFLSCPHRPPQELEAARVRQLQLDRQLVSGYEAEVAAHVAALEGALQQLEGGRGKDGGRGGVSYRAAGAGGGGAAMQLKRPAASWR